MVLGIRFSTRSPQRDQDGDRARIQSVREALLAARASAERESAGLQKRILEWQSRATALMDTTADYGLRHPDEEAALTEATSAATKGEERLKTIAYTISGFDKMLAQLDELERSPLSTIRAAIK